MTAPRAPRLLRADRRVARGLIFDLGVEFDTEQRDDGRVSTTGQTLATQKALLRAAGVARMFSEKVSDVAARRPELARVIDELESGDVLVVTKLDRLARSTLDLLRIVDQIGREGAGFKSLGDPWADTTTSAGRLMLTVLSLIAEFERDLILQRTNEGRMRAKAEGTRFGRKPKRPSTRRVRR